ncbi:hypothetical protein ACIKT0_10970 [Hansschlegelia beijingensis]|uniref:hypothetical protein n=1 Tax=Hansschlegelia beijingensis TaxID=1133344 RepID=UPI00387F327B
MNSVANPLSLGFYSVNEAARLIEMGSARRIYGWLRGYPGRQAGPLIARQFQPLNGAEEISFLDLMELRLIEMLREQDVRPRTIRAAINEARKIFGNEKPFATDKILLKTDGKRVFVEEVLKKAAKDEQDRRLWNLVTKQYEHYELIERSLIQGVVFDPKTSLARTWNPRPNRFPDIIIDPRLAYGKPVVPSKIPTEAIFDLWKAEGESLEAASNWLEVPISEADMAVRFEQELRRQPEPLAA